MIQKLLTCNCLYFGFEVYFQLRNEGLNLICLQPNCCHLKHDLSSTILSYPASTALLLASNTSFSNFSFSRSKDFYRIFNFLLALSSTWSAKNFACSAVFCLSKTAKYNPFDFPCELELRVTAEGWKWTEVQEWQDIFDFDLPFLSLEGLDVSHDLADLLDNCENISSSLFFLFNP